MELEYSPSLVREYGLGIGRNFMWLRGLATFKRSRRSKQTFATLLSKDFRY